MRAKQDALAAGSTPEDANRAAMRVISGKTDSELSELQHHNPSAFEQLASTATLFPAAMQDSELGEIPEGWTIQKTEEIANKIAMGPFGSNIKVATFVDEGVPIISGKHLNETLMEEGGHNFITEEHADKLRNSNVYAGDLIFTHAGNIGQVSLISRKTIVERFVISQRQFYLRPNPEMTSANYLVYFFRSPKGQHVLLANTSQVGVPSIARPSSYLKSIELICPPKPLLSAFDRIADSIHDQLWQNRLQSQTLEHLRDTLLPKLLSGELQLPDGDA